MKPALPPILLVEDDRNMRRSLETMLADEGYTVRAVESAEAGLRALNQGEFFMIITDVRLGGMSGHEFLARVRERWPELPAVMITAYATTKQAVEAIKAGVMDYLAKPFAAEDLLRAVDRCAERYAQWCEMAALRAQVGGIYRLEDILGEAPAMVEVRRLIATVAPTDATVLIRGESGTGKELAAGALHGLSRRHAAPYIRINCAAIPEALLESELFGHEKGAFTGAHKQKPGRVEEADGGTIFLDEIADMSLALQAKLLRFLEDGTFTRVGGNRERRVNVRLLAATNRDLTAAIRAGRFREDLFHRLNVVPLLMPPLRERGGDILLLAEHFREQFARLLRKPVRSIGPAARDKLQAYHWPGNVRELRNAMERALILETTEAVQSSSLPEFPLAAPAPGAGRSLDDVVAEFERGLVLAALERNRFSVSRAARDLQISRHSLRYRMQRLHITCPEADQDESAAGEESEANPD